MPQRPGHATQSRLWNGRRIGAVLTSTVVAVSCVAALGPGRAAEAASSPSGGSIRMTSVRIVNGRPVIERRTVSSATAGYAVAAGNEEIDQRVQALGARDPLKDDQWALTQLAIYKPWVISKGYGVKVAVVDTGVAVHEDLNAGLIAGIDLVTDTGNGQTDPAGHGTHVAGIIGARLRNGLGVAGVAPRVKIMPVRVLDANGSGYTSDVAEGIVWAADNGAKVINLSLGGPSPSEVMQTAIQYAVGRGAVVLAAAGNNYESGNPTMYPAAYPEAIAVAAVDSQRRRATFSNTGSYVDIAAPGVSIVSAYGGSTANAYAYMSGTSMATPHVAGTIALMIAADKSLTPSVLRKRLLKSAIDIGAAGMDPKFGAGIVNPTKAVRRPISTAPASSSSTIVSAGTNTRLTRRATALRPLRPRLSW